MPVQRWMMFLLDIVEDSWLKLLWQQPRTLTGAGEAVNAGRADFM